MITKHKVDHKVLTYEIIISKGLGKLTKKSENMIVELATNAIRKKLPNKISEDDKMDCLQLGLFNMLTKWFNFDPKVANNAFTYFTEIFKRSIPEMLDIIYSKRGLKKDEQQSIRFISMNSINSGDGMYNV